MPGYREEDGVAPDSMTETFVAAKLYVDNWRWADVPFYVRTGKRLAAARDDDRHPVQARPHPPFAEIAAEELRPNVLVDPHPAGRGHLARDRRQGARAGMTIRDRAHGLPLRRGVPHRTARGVRAADPRRDARRRHAVHAQPTRSRSSGRSWTRSSAAWAPRPAELPELPGRNLGAGGANEFLGHDGRAWRTH